jgi:hypothetical protein
MREKRNAYRILVGKLGKKKERPLGRPRQCEHNIKIDVR